MCRVTTLSETLVVLLACTMHYGHAQPTTGPASQPATGPVIQGMVLNESGGGIARATVRIESLDAAADDPPLVEVVSNSTGDISAQLPRPLQGSVRVRVHMDGFNDFVDEYDVSDPENPPFIDATLTGTAVLTGRVSAAATGKPLAGVAVRCETGLRSLNAQTDTDGEFSFTNVTRGNATLTFTAEGFGIERRIVGIMTNHAKTDIQLRPERAVEVNVEDNLGKPAAAVAIEALIEPSSDYIEATTDANGRARLKGVHLEATAIQFRLNGDRYVRNREFVKSITMPDPTTQPEEPLLVTRRLTVRIAARMTGKVVNAAGEPVSGTRVFVGKQLRPDMPTTWTDDEGKYELARLEPGFSIVSFQHLDYATSIRECRLPPDQVTTLDAKLLPGKPLGGTIVDNKGRPVGAVFVSADSWKGYETLGLRLLTGDDGRFGFDNAPDGEIEFSFVKPGFGPPVTQTLAAGKSDYRIVLKEEAVAADNSGAEAKIQTGDAMPDLAVTDTDGMQYKLADLRGKYVFLDCWASWCGPCVAEIPNLKALREATRDRTDFLLLGISLDRDRDAFKAAIKKHGMDWPQVFGPKSGGTEVFEALNGVGIPYTCLIGPDGKILAQNIRGPDTVDEVKKHLPKKRE
ncbi:MAG: carboxypeptidase regulatory-like domain-containing protein [Phycisphaerae bacterium]|nr:carboxypeptidase regulatory-like domain-containing protein [Phycisphaerae bacterium]